MEKYSALQSGVSKLLLEHIKEGLRVSGSRHEVRIQFSTKQDAAFVAWTLREGYVHEEDIRQAVHATLCRVGKEMYVWHLRKPLENYPDHCLCPAALGYIYYTSWRTLH